MTACPESGPSAGVRLTIGPTPDDGADSCPPVVSLSPSSIGRGVPGVSHQRMFLSPRVIDQAAFDDLSHQLRALIDGAAAVADTLNETMSRAETLEASSSRATGQLQERLRLGARMIKALQTQLDRVSDAANRDASWQRDIDAACSLDASREAADRIESRVQSVESSLTDATDQALRRFEQVERSVAERERTLHELDDRIARLEARLDAVGQAAIEEFDRRAIARRQEIDELAGRVDELSARLSTMAETIGEAAPADDVRESLTDLTNRGAVAKRRLESMIEQAEQVRRLLEGDLLAATDQIDELGEESGRLQQLLADHVGVAAARQAQLQRVLDQAGRAGVCDSGGDRGTSDQPDEPEIVVRRERAE